MSLFRPVLLLPLALAACTETMTQSATTATTAPAAATAAAPAAAPAPTPETAALRAPAPRPTARTAAQFDTTTAAQKAEAAKAPAASAETALGETVASLGDPSQGGFWLKTPLVKTRTQGRVVNPANGKSSKVELIPLSGPASAGSQLSLPAMQLLGISLTDLPKIRVFRS
ncbi:MAG: hypothetical protein Q4G24_04225 [Paracoccus sp. (in: a-proteobacteria)]|uniref:hypothetical protein n=1 Tax=Paracoccus sp. TaxID=267 RepID=UPI0026DEB26C|nr:hypothetical protein [Paracoccus sp. (in: a-proteobacteria)]MDO5620657.1 hypothetical protein [Paracoccus sp. (in: a-proteobacteria)]